MILSQTLHTFKTGETHVGAQLDGENLVIGETRNEEHAAEGKFGNLLTVIPLAEAVAMAKAILAAQEQAELDEMVEAMYQRHLDRFALVDDALESEIRF